MPLHRPPGARQGGFGSCNPPILQGDDSEERIQENVPAAINLCDHAGVARRVVYDVDLVRIDPLGFEQEYQGSRRGIAQPVGEQ
ncbi:hypothetical protein BLTE_29980 [Blastochloris tepida]|uniref:Uncharacterized protein n=1 Tax=Blastochloris tepida TaxID=2233851 RepID=A0A348G430_9HYPH|nr:hypothetical protein BLTE_29980 [Blastochloris tepida]